MNQKGLRKVQLFNILFIELFLSSKIGKMIPLKLKQNLKVYQEKLIPKIIEVANERYYLRDLECLWTVSPGFEKDVWDYLKVNKGDVFVDIGAHIGGYTIRIAIAVREDGKVLAIEADPVNYEFLKKNILLNNIKNVIAIRCAAYNSRGQVRFNFGYSSWHGSVYGKGEFGYTYVEAFPVDELLAYYELAPDWIKIDVEGAEYEVLEGLKGTLMKISPKLVIEVSHQNLKKVKKLMEEELDYRGEVIFSDLNCSYIFFNKK